MSHDDFSGVPQVQHSVQEAAKLVGKDRKTIYRHIKNGRLSCGKDDNGNSAIETTELIRVYGAFKNQLQTHVRQKAGKSPHAETENAAALVLTELVGQMRQLREENKGLSRSLDELRKELDTIPRLENKTSQKATGYMGRVWRALLNR